ncbi:hypothetical protein ABH935_001037 [Catenulispora sp. GAS73]|uniref:hypothetical protein n=1 Tax=Catenulispora sp. GAS73 TaxID=3156269 RepID=UPI0035127999
MERVEPSPHYLRYWDLTEKEETGGDAISAAEVVATADAVAASYREQDFGSYPGLTLQRAAGTPADSLGICVAPFGWALIHTDEGFAQMITHSDRPLDGTDQQVWFEDILEIGTVCFIDRGLAVEAIGTWMACGGLLAAAGFTDDLFAA